MAVDGALPTECHIWAWLDEIPLLGVAGDEALGSQLDGFLTGMPFLPVKSAALRGVAVPSHPDRAASLAAIRDFAQEASRKPVKPLDLPKEFTFAVAMGRQLADLADGQQGLQRRSPQVLDKTAEVFARDACPARQAAMGAALSPLLAAQGDLDLTSESAMREQDPATLSRCRDYFDAWAATDEPAWPQ